MYDEILIMMATESFVNIKATPAFTSIESYHNRQTHADMVIADIEKWAKDHDVKAVVSRGATPLFGKFFNEDDTSYDDIELYDGDGFVKMRIELFYH